MDTNASTGELNRARRERDFYERLLAVGTQSEIEPFLREGLEFVVELTGARAGYIEIHPQSVGAEAGRTPCWWHAVGFSEEDLAGVRAALSFGIVAEAIATRRMVRTASARTDSRFVERDSVRWNQIDAVVCAPFGDDAPEGVVYLQGRVEGGPFSDDSARLIETFARFLSPRVEHLLDRHVARDGVDATAAARARLQLPGIVGTSAALGRLLDSIALVAPLEIDVLLTGPTGSGKTAFARAIARNSQRASGPFVQLNCAALPESLVESELFGALAGAHSTAVRPVEGKVAAANGGTLFLDEVGELSPAAQAKLLQVLTERIYYQLGSSTPVQADVRIIAATNADLPAAILSGRFRADLYYRLHVVPLRVPSLEERREDVPALVTHAAAQICQRLGLPPIEAAPSALRAAESAEWPGNVRQLIHAVEQGVIRCHGEGGVTLQRRHLFPEDARAAPDVRLSFVDATRQFQRQYLMETLDETQWNVAEAGRLLDLTRSHVYNLLKLHGLRRSGDEESTRM